MQHQRAMVGHPPSRTRSQCHAQPMDRRAEPEAGALAERQGVTYAASCARPAVRRGGHGERFRAPTPHGSMSVDTVGKWIQPAQEAPSSLIPMIAEHARSHPSALMQCCRVRCIRRFGVECHQYDICRNTGKACKTYEEHSNQAAW